MAGLSDSDLLAMHGNDAPAKGGSLSDDALLAQHGAAAAPKGFPYNEPGKTYGAVLPFAKDDKTGALEFAVPDAIRAPVRGAIEFGQGLMGKRDIREPESPDMAAAAMSFGGIKPAPGAGARGMPGAASPVKTPREPVAGPGQMRTERFVPESGIPADYDPLTGQHKTVQSGPTVAHGIGANKKIPDDYFPHETGKPPPEEVRFPDEHDPAVGDVSPGMKIDAKKASSAGYTLPPEMATDKAGPGAKLAGAFGGQEKIQMAASKRNQVNTDRLANETMGTDARNPLTSAVYNNVRVKAGQAYAKVVEKLQKVGGLEDDPVWHADLENARDLKGFAKTFTKTSKNPEIDAQYEELVGMGDMPTGDALKKVQDLRNHANQNFKANGDSRAQKHDLAMAQRAFAEAIEQAIERRIGDMEWRDPSVKGVMDGYRRARTLIAQSYDLEASTVGGQVLASRLSKLQASGRPLTGNLATIASAYDKFGKAMRNPSQVVGMQDFSYLDAAGALAAGASGHPLALGGILARPLARKYVLSPNYQAGMFRPPTPPGPTSQLPFAMGSGIADAINPPMPPGDQK